MNNIDQVILTLKRGIIIGKYIPLKYRIKNKNDNEDLEKYKDKKKIILMQTPTHKNLGDHAIAYAEREFVKKYLPDYIVLEIPFWEVYGKAEKVKSIMKKNDFIFIIGGGNMTDMYIEEEYMRRFIIKYFRKFNVISFPQTIDFSDTIIGKLESLKSRIAYRKNKNLVVVAREKKSFEIMNKVYSKNKVLLTPDIVLFLDKRENEKRDGVVTCLRSDIEGVLDKAVKEEIFKSLRSNFNKIVITDTVIDKDVPINKREVELNKIWSKFRQAEVVVTDRLHGMIFCAITATPCVVFSNSNHKIEQSYKNWLSNLDYIKFISKNEVSTLNEIIKEIKSINKRNNKFNSCSDKYKDLTSIIEGIVS